MCSCPDQKYSICATDPRDFAFYNICSIIDIIRSVIRRTDIDIAHAFTVRYLANESCVGAVYFFRLIESLPVCGVDHSIGTLGTCWKDGVPYIAKE